MSTTSPQPVADPPRPPARRWTAARVGAAVLAVAALALTAVLHATHHNLLVLGLSSTDMRELHADFDTFWHSAVALTQGGDIYETPAKLRNLNPPLLSLLLAPLAGLDVVVAYRVFAAVTLLLIAGAVLLVCRELRLPWWWTAGATLAMLASSPLHGTLYLGQIYGLLLVGLVAGWIAERRGHPLLAGVLYGVTVALKPSLAPVLLLPAVQQRWRPFFAGVGGAVVATLVGALAAGPSSALEWLRIGFGEPVPDVLDNAALPGEALRLGLPSGVGTVLGLVALVGTLVWLARRSRTGTVDPGGTAPWAVIAAGLLMSPISWHNYLLLLWPGVLAVVAASAAGSVRRAWVAALLALPLVPVSWGELWTPDDPWTPLGRSLYCAILLAYWVTLLRNADRTMEP
ncbi:glycosyltransferase family 87 protein [Pseudonocardia halophobica]|uniref:glycosyltransferase family 87 protein n=1 Tax=Pseudonocardia halophobica TaxID=29401 RepID=UPI000561A17D|nr:glycosyltransferase family 87 protein [Pseudonocardia halophobica]